MHATNEMLIRVIDFVSDRISVRRKDLGPDTMLRLHLNIDGNLAVAFLEAFQRRFSVDMSDFRFSTYFRDDKQITLLSPVLEFVRHCCRRLGYRLGVCHPGPQITLRDLAWAATVGRWQEQKASEPD